MKIARFSFILLLSMSLWAAPFSSFRGGKIYAVEGRWFHIGNHFLFKINEGNANEEVIIFLNNPQGLNHQIKYRLCFKVLKDCQLNCEAVSLKNLKMLKPWDSTAPITASSDGPYPEESCQ